MAHFEVGDIVVKKYGKKPLKVVYCRDVNYGGSRSTRTYRLQYLHSKQTVECKDYDIKKYEGEIEGEDIKMTNKLYQTKDGRYGVALGENSEGKIVLEIKGSGELIPFDKKEIEVVMPYTFSIRYNQTSGDVHYKGKAGALSVGDLVLETSNKSFSVGVVTGVDTKKENAHKKFNGVKIVTEAISE